MNSFYIGAATEITVVLVCLNTQIKALYDILK